MPSGTESSCHQGPKSKPTPWRASISRSLNFTNLESFGFLLTEIVSPVSGDVWRDVSARRRRSACDCREFSEALRRFPHPCPFASARSRRTRGCTCTPHSLPAKWSSRVNDHTTVELLWLKGRIENRIRFGHPTSERMVDRHRRVLSFCPGSIFAFVRWTSNDFGTVLSRIDIVRAATPGQSYSTLPWVIPGGESLLRLSGWTKVERVLQLIETIEGLQIDPVEAAPDYWHHVHNRLSVNETPKVYTRARHQAWLHRREVTS